MQKRTPLYDCHLAAGAKMIDFSGWDMPLHYGSQLQEHQAVRNQAGLFDVSHMTIVDIEGKEARAYLTYLLANNINRLSNGSALYSCLLNEQGGVLDDLIVYQLSDTFYRVIVNSATREKDLAWFRQQAASYPNLLLKEKNDLAMLAIQGPQIREKIPFLFSNFSNQEQSILLALKPFQCAMIGNYFVARTGYTGEDGFEIILSAQEASLFWQRCLAASIIPCGLGARDTLRLEAGLNLYGADMDETVTPFESNLGWTVALEPKDRNFIGRRALEKKLKEGVERKLVGLVLESAGVLRNHQRVRVEEKGEGEITSGSFSPTLNKGIALARIPAYVEKKQCLVEIRAQCVPAQIIQPPFIRQGKKTF